LSASATSDDDEVTRPLHLDGPIGVLIVADIRLYRDGLADTLGQQQRIRVLGAAADPEEAIARARSLPPDVIVVDMAMRDGLRAVRLLSRDVPQAGILALAVPDAPAEIISCVEAGAAGCVTREAPLQEVVSGVEGIVRGESPCSPRVSAVLFDRVKQLAAGQPKAAEAPLTKREQEILGLIEAGLSNKEIAQRLYIETATVKNHVHSILQKLHVTRRGEAAASFRHDTTGDK
jgi:two-component system, NarL family, nitrate/nitrite response regulator NarL